MCASNHFSISSRFPCFSRSRFFRVEVFQGPGFQGLGPGYRSNPNLAVESEISDNNSKKLDESWTFPTFLQLNGWGEFSHFYLIKSI